MTNQGGGTSVVTGLMGYPKGGTLETCPFLASHSHTFSFAHSPSHCCATLRQTPVLHNRPFYTTGLCPVFPLLSIGYFIIVSEDKDDQIVLKLINFKKHWS